MTFELKDVNDWVRNKLVPEKLDTASPSTEQYAKWTVYIKEQREKICENFLIEAAQTADPQAMRLYIQNNQKAAIILSELLYEYGTTSIVLPAEAKMLYREASQQLEIILHDLNRFFPCYFDQHVPVTRTYSEQKMRSLTEKYKRINKLVKYKQADQTLLQIVLGELRKFMYGQERMVTYYRVWYYEQLLDSLMPLSPDDVEADADCRIHEVLLSLNFNDPVYVRYYAHQIASVVGIFKRLTDKMEKLHWYRKTIRQEACRPGIILLVDHPSLAEQMTAWLDEEIAYLHAIHQLALSTAQGREQPKFDQKIRLTLSVSELGALVHVLYRLGITKRAQLIDLVRVFAETCSTTGTEEISVKSLRNKSCSIKNSPIPAEHVRKLLQRGAELISAELSK